MNIEEEIKKYTNMSTEELSEYIQENSSDAAYILKSLSLSSMGPRQAENHFDESLDMIVALMRDKGLKIIRCDSGKIDVCFEYRGSSEYGDSKSMRKILSKNLCELFDEAKL